MMLSKIIVPAVCIAILAAPALAATLTPVNLRCEYRDNPMGIDVRAPRFSWVLESNEPSVRGQKQTAYQILVASTPEALKADKGDIWDSGKVVSDQTNQIVYSGPALRSEQRCFWKVRTWNGEDQPSGWSEPALWTMGLLEDADWKAKWIGYDAPASSADEPVFVDLKGAKWVWFDEGDPLKDAPKGERFFRHSFTMPQRPVKRAMFAITADNAFKLYVNGKEAGSGGNFNVPVLIDVAAALKPNANVFAIEAANADGPAGLIGRLKVEYDNGDVFIRDIDKEWMSAAKRQQGWETEQFAGKDWTPAKEIATAGDAPWGMPEVKQLILPPPPYLRGTFKADQPIKRATVYATALGIYELTINGQRVGEDYFTPGWTDYHDRVYYNTYDVTELVKSGENAMGVLLGDGWYAGYLGYQGVRNFYKGEPRLRVQLNLEFADGSKRSVVTDESWKASYGAVREADHLMGTVYDARRALGDWDKPGYDDSKWQPVVVDGSKAPKLVQAYPCEPVRRIEELAARKMTEPQPGMYVFDLGQNMVGWARLRFRAGKGDKVVFRYAEMLNPDGTLYTTALRTARATNTYYPATDGEHTWEPPHTFHGFQYVEITGVETPPDLSSVTGIVAHNEMTRTGWFECSEPLVNRLVENIIWGQKGNYFEAPTDCPQRDERLGWTGDAQAFIRTGAYNFDISAFMTKWLVDLVQDSQYPDGSFADVAPNVLNGHGNVGWADAGIICPYVVYRWYGDTRQIEQHYANMAKYIEYLEKTSKDLVRPQGAYGDWLNLGGGAKSEVIGTAYFAYVTRLLGEMAAVIGKDDDAKRYNELADRVKEKFIAEFVMPDGGIKESSQTGFALAFSMDLLPEEIKAKATEKFIEEIKKKEWHLATGFIGTSRLLPALTIAGRSDVAYRLLMNEDFPSWLYQVKIGATTMWERWDGWRPDKGFQDAGMNSFNHYAFGAVGEWLYRTAAGIDFASPGFKKIVIRPQPGGGLTHAKATYDSINGRIVSGWKLDGDNLTMDVTIPPNTTATVHVPAKDAKDVTEGGKPAGESKGVRFVEIVDDSAVYEVGSGTYQFTAKK